MNVALTHSKIERPTPQHRGIARVFALIMTFALMCAGLVAGGTAAHAAGSQTVKGVLTGWQLETSDYQDVTVSLTPKNGNGSTSQSGGHIDAAGNFEITNIDPGEYFFIAYVFNGTGDADNYFQSGQLINLGTQTNSVVVAQDATVNQNLTMQRANASIGGHIQVQGKQKAQVIVDQKFGGEWVTISSAWGGSGMTPVDYATYGLAPGEYRVNFLAYTGSEVPEQLWWDNVFGEQLAKSVVLTAGQQQTGIDALFRTDFDARPQGVSVSGTARVGSPLTAQLDGAWSPTPEKLEYRWSPVASNGPGGPPQVTGQAYTPIPSDVGGDVLLQVTAESADRKLDFVETSVRVLPGLLTTATPTISGTPQVGQKLTAKPGTWGPSGVKLAYQWLRDGAAISGATASTYTAVAADQGKKLSVKVSGSATGYTNAAKTSAATAAVTAADPGTPAAPPFTDIAQGDKFYKEIAWMYQSGLTTGVKVGDHREYQPKNSVSREAMAAFLFRMDPDSKTYVAPKSSPFADVPTSHQFYTEIAWMYDQKISTGVKQPSGKPKYDAKTQVSREAMAAFLFRLDDRGYTTPQTSRFSDIAPGDKFYREMSWMYDANISTGVKQPSGKPAYQPKSSVTREAMAAFLYRID